MKQFDCDSDSTATGPAHDRSGAPLFTFLEVAEQLYERIAQALGQVGLSYAKYELLHHLSSKGPVSLGILAEAQRCARSNITQLVDRLETEGLVRRVSDPDDRRGVRAEITPLGAARAVEGAAQIDAVRAQFSASLSDAESQQLVQLLAKVRKDQS